MLQELARRDQFEPNSPMSVNLDSSDVDEHRDNQPEHRNYADSDHEFEIPSEGEVSPVKK